MQLEVDDVFRKIDVVWNSAVSRDMIASRTNISICQSVARNLEFHVVFQPFFSHSITDRSTNNRSVDVGDRCEVKVTADVIWK